MSAADQLFLETTRRLAPPSLALGDARTALGCLGSFDGPLADLGCGYGRHLRAFESLGFTRLIGVDRSALLLNAAHSESRSARLIRGDLRALPICDASLGAAACFYSSMFLGSESDALAALRECARVLKPGAKLVITTDNPLRLRAAPQAHFREGIAGLGLVEETSEFDPQAGLDRVQRTLVRDDGERLSATFTIRYFLPDALAALARAAGLAWIGLVPDAALTERTPQLICLLSRSEILPRP